MFNSKNDRFFSTQPKPMISMRDMSPSRLIRRPYAPHSSLSAATDTSFVSKNAQIKLIIKPEAFGSLLVD